MSAVEISELSPAGEPAAAGHRPRTWAYVGVVAGLAGVIGIQASGFIDAAYAEGVAGDAVAIANRLADQRTAVVVMHVSLMIAALLMLVFAAGLARRLSDRLPEGTLLPAVAGGGLVLTSAACLLGTGFTTELIFGLGHLDEVVPEYAVVGAHWMGTIPWLWAGVGVSALAVASGMLRHGAGPRWMGWTSLVLGGLTALFGVSPLQYMAGFTGPVWVLVVAIGFAFGDRARG
ncbi:hypothetical protein GS463_18795 [Rhodococcus hoagii]|uniref:Uncharacterized protein n=1 Tax=Rhodococcus hoagii TaxID=43767 RepID=A0AAE2W6B3_RHOHA|nr:hypothetical protein [Prescottella equi]MBM4714651.1 hypothetical protein [Prescottella equi]NKS11413.1 hypothetical protein [Prescottella equi]